MYRFAASLSNRLEVIVQFLDIAVALFFAGAPGYTYARFSLNFGGHGRRKIVAFAVATGNRRRKLV